MLLQLDDLSLELIFSARRKTLALASGATAV